MRKPVQVTIIVLAACWAGMIAGVSLLATPVKFLAPSLTMSTALDVGRHTFNIFSHIEIVFALAILGAIFFAKPGRLVMVLLILMGSILLVQHLWLLPTLDARVGLILEGKPVLPSYHHHLYAFSEGLKVTLLLAVSILEARRPASR